MKPTTQIALFIVPIEQLELRLTLLVHNLPQMPLVHLLLVLDQLPVLRIFYRLDDLKPFFGLVLDQMKAV